MDQGSILGESISRKEVSRKERKEKIQRAQRKYNEFEPAEFNWRVLASFALLCGLRVKKI